MHTERNIAAVDMRVLQCAPNLFHQFWRQRLIRIEQQYPVKRQRKVVHSPLSLLGPPSLIVKLHNLSAKRLCNLRRRILTLRIDNVNLTNIAKRFQAARQVLLFIACGNDRADRQLSRLYATTRLGCGFNSWHSIGNYRCCSHQRCSTYRDHGLDHETAPPKKSCQICCTWRPFNSLPNGPSFTLSAFRTGSISDRNSWRIQLSKGNVKPRLRRRTISSGNDPARAAIN